MGTRSARSRGRGMCPAAWRTYGSLIAVAVALAGATSCSQQYSLQISTPEFSQSGAAAMLAAEIPGCPPVVSPNLRSILFYAPDIYARIGGAQNDNTFMLSAQSALRAAGFTVTIRTAIDARFDACQMYTDYAQLWLFLPCNNLQTLPADNLAVVRKLYQAGRGVAVFGDDHFFSGATLNDHCGVTLGDPKPFFGTGDSPSDVARIVTDVMGSQPVSWYTAAAANPLASDHPLYKAWIGGFVLPSWNYQFRIDSRADIRDACGSGCENERLLLESKDGPTGVVRRLFFSMVDYNYHLLGLTATTTQSLPAKLAYALQETARYLAGATVQNSGQGSSLARAATALPAAPASALVTASVASAGPVAGLSEAPISAALSSAQLAVLKAAAREPFDKHFTVQLGSLLQELTGREPAADVLPALAELLRFPITSVRHQASVAIRHYYIDNPSLPALLSAATPAGSERAFAVELLAASGAEGAPAALVSALAKAPGEASLLEALHGLGPKARGNAAVGAALAQRCAGVVSAGARSTCQAAGF